MTLVDCIKSVSSCLRSLPVVSCVMIIQSTVGSLNNLNLLFNFLHRGINKNIYIVQVKACYKRLTQIDIYFCVVMSDFHYSLLTQ